MSSSITQEAFVFICSALCGGLLYFLYDLFRVIRKESFASSAIIHLQEAVFWTLALVVMFFGLLYLNNGVVRFYELVGAILGAILYGLTLSKWVLQFFCRILTFFSRFFKLFFKILLTPILFMYNIFYRSMRFFCLPILRCMRRAGKRIKEKLTRSFRFSKKK